ncbi:hypothetical protein SDC9_56635 [bioreactor metagenome]|uniref:Stage II sporulation protein M n=1 Tax=bioreactor metagenome TaxID=1076179 RepID=A0A644X2F6_9ZZZZ
MKEITFINQNSSRWNEYQIRLSDPGRLSPDELGDMFIHITDDLSYARCFFPQSSTTEFLNGLAARFHNEIYENKHIDKREFLGFFRKELPLLMYNARKELLVSFVIFVVAFTAGVFSAFQDESYIRAVLGDGYVNMTLENIRNGDPMAVYKSDSQMGSFILILINNIKVALITYVFGIFLSFGAMVIVFNNGTMIGAFVSLFYIYGGFTESLLSVWMHGTIEICTLVISGCAGIHMGKGFLFPGTFKRKTAFIKTARESGRILLGVIPFIAIAAFIEGFFTRHTEWSDVFQVVFIFSTLLLMVFYFVIYPVIKYNQERRIHGKI